MPPAWWFDEDAQDIEVIDALRYRGYVVYSVREHGTMRCPDEQVLQDALQVNAVVVTFNSSDFARIHHDCLAAGRHHAGIAITPGTMREIGFRVRTLLAVAEHFRELHLSWSDQLIWLARYAHH